MTERNAEKNKKSLLYSPKRRKLLRLAPLALLAGCDMTPGTVAEPFLLSFQRFNDWVQSKVFDPEKLAPEFADNMLTPEEGFRVNGLEPPEVDFENWRLTVGGLVEKPGEYTIGQISSLPKQVKNLRHCCVEGWSMIPKWGGTVMKDFLRSVGADMSAKYVSVKCGDDYYTSYDMPSILHPQTLLAYEAYNKPLTVEHGAPLRIVMPTKLGYKSAKWINEIVVSNEKTGGYWEDLGYDWYAGL